MGIEKDIEIEVIADDDSLKTLGELLASKTSRDLMKFLMNKSTYKMKISDELGVPFSLVEHHLKKLEKLGLVKITNKKLIKGGVLHKTYKITGDGIFLMLNTTKEEIKEKGILKRIFKDSVKFVVIGIAAFTSWLVTKSDSLEIIENIEGDMDMSAPKGLPLDVTSPLIVIPIIIIGCSVFLIWFSRKYK